MNNKRYMLNKGRLYYIYDIASNGIMELTDIEVQIFEMIVSGLTNMEIGEEIRGGKERVEKSIQLIREVLKIWEDKAVNNQIEKNTRVDIDLNTFNYDCKMEFPSEQLVEYILSSRFKNIVSLYLYGSEKFSEVEVINIAKAVNKRRKSPIPIKFVMGISHLAKIQGVLNRDDLEIVVNVASKEIDIARIVEMDAPNIHWRLLNVSDNVDILQLISKLNGFGVTNVAYELLDPSQEGILGAENYLENWERIIEHILNDVNSSCQIYPLAHILEVLSGAKKVEDAVYVNYSMVTNEFVEDPSTDDICSQCHLKHVCTNKMEARRLKGTDNHSCSLRIKLFDKILENYMALANKIASASAESAEVGEMIFTLQWHITAECDQRCKHCYMFESSTYQNERDFPLNFHEVNKVLDNYKELIDRWGVKGRVIYTGGDPLLRNDFKDILVETHRRGFGIRILGNPFHVNGNTVSMMKENGVGTYQLSLDGMREKHDSFRKEGSFEATLKALKLLKDGGIKTMIMFTLSKDNWADFPMVVETCVANGVDYFVFDRIVPLGCGESLETAMFTGEEYREVLESIYSIYLKNQNRGTEFLFKDNLWKLFFYEKNPQVMFSHEKEMIYGGCKMGCNFLTILTDGTVVPCRRMPIRIGKVPEDRLETVFTESSVLNSLREPKNYEKCSHCDLLYYCRGCPAVAFAKNKDYFAQDPQCWREVSECSPKKS